MYDNQYVQAFAAALDDPSALDAQVTWYSNGERGHLHGSSRCPKLDTRKEPFTRTLAITEAARHNTCQRCFEYALALVFPSYRELQMLLATHESMRRIASEASKPQSLIGLYRLLDGAKTLIGYHWVSGRVADGDEFTRTRNDIRNDVLRIKEELRAQLRSRADELLPLVAREMLDTSIHAEGWSSIATEAENRLLGVFPGSSQRSVLRLHRAWLEAVKTGGHDDEITTAVLSVASEITLLEREELHGLPFTGSDGERFRYDASYLAGERDRVTRRMLRRWEDERQGLLTRTRPVVVTVARRRIAQHSLLDIALTCHTVASNETQQFSVARVPELVANWLTGFGSTRGQGGNASVSILGADEIDDVVLDTTAKLWDPSSETFADPRACLKAAAALHG